MIAVAVWPLNELACFSESVDPLRIKDVLALGVPTDADKASTS